MNVEYLSQEWIKAQSSESSTESNHWSVDYVIDLPLEEEYEDLWNFIKITYIQPLPEKVFGLLAAGALEDFLGGTGQKYIEEVSDMARRDPKFRLLLGGVWQGSISNETWYEILKIRGDA